MNEKKAKEVTASDIFEAARSGVAAKMQAEETEGYANERMREATIKEAAIITLLEASSNISQAILAGMWQVFLNSDFELLGEFNSFTEWALDKLAPYAAQQTITDLSRIVIRTLAKVHQRASTDKPFKLEDGTIVTAKMLIDKPGLVRKLKDTSATFEENEDNEGVQEQIIQAVATKTAAEVAELNNKLNGKTVIKIPFTATSMSEGFVSVTMKLDEKQFLTLRTLLGKSAEEHIA